LLARIARLVISLGISILPLLYIAGYLSFIPGLPSPSSLFGGALTGASGSQATSIFGVGTGLGSLVPFGAFGASGLIIFTIFSRVGSTVSSAVRSPSVPSIANMRSVPGMTEMLSGMNQMSRIPESLPEDLTKSQYVILNLFRSGSTKSGDIAKNLSMEKGDVDKAIGALRINGYLSENDKLTTKGMDTLS
jgi:hypothetical protein